jgi:hypothetical protein
VAVRGPLTSRDTNFASAHCGRDRPQRAGEDVLYVRQTGAVQGQRESSTEPHTKKCGNVLSCTRRGRTSARAAIQVGGEAFRQEGVWRFKNWPKIRRLVRNCLRPHG